jgi:DNA-binding IclR family transcriptional regulator
VSCRFLTNHGRALLCLANEPELRIRDLAAALDITERSAQKIVGDLVKGGYVTRKRVGRRNTYRVNVDRPLVIDQGLSIRHLLGTFRLPAEREQRGQSNSAVTLA